MRYLRNALEQKQIYIFYRERGVFIHHFFIVVSGYGIANRNLFLEEQFYMVDLSSFTII